jgi:hypothetical protein
MIEVNQDHCRIVRDSMSGDRAVDEQTFASLTILAERLERVRKTGMDFSDVAFSPDARNLMRRTPASCCRKTAAGAVG